MKPRSISEDLRRQYVESFRFELDRDFARQMARLIKRNVTLVGVLGTIALLLFLSIQILFLDKRLVDSYSAGSKEEILVVWDKLVMFAVFFALLGVRRFIPDDRPGQGRVAMLLGSMIVVAAIAIDDAGMQTVHFLPAYVTMVILFLAVAVPMHTGWVVAAIGLVIATGYVSVEVLPPWFGLEPDSLDADYRPYLAVIALIATAASTLLYNVRHEEYTARKIAENLSQSLAETNRSLEEAIRTLTTTQERLIYVEKMASLGRFATGVAHEMRNPLNFILNFSRLSVEILEESEASGAPPHPDSEDLKVNLERIHSHAARAEEIVKSLIAHSQQRSSQPSHIDLNRLIKEQTSVLSRRYDADRSGQSVRLVLDLGETVGQIEALPAELTYAIENIVDNAYRAVIDRARTNEADYEPEVVVKTVRADNTVRIEITDNGVGMDGEQTGKIFEPFYTTRPAGSGTGLGLASAYAAITEGHGGTISVESRRGSGSAFTIELGEFPH